MLGIVLIAIYHQVLLVVFQGLTQVEEMLISAVTDHVIVPTTSWTVLLQWACHQPATGSGRLCKFFTTTAR